MCMDYICLFVFGLWSRNNTFQVLHKPEPCSRIVSHCVCECKYYFCILEKCGSTIKYTKIHCTWSSIYTFTRRHPDSQQTVVSNGKDSRDQPRRMTVQMIYSIPLYDDDLGVPVHTLQWAVFEMINQQYKQMCHELQHRVVLKLLRSQLGWTYCSTRFSFDDGTATTMLQNRRGCGLIARFLNVSHYIKTGCIRVVGEQGSVCWLVVATAASFDFRIDRNYGIVNGWLPCCKWNCRQLRTANTVKKKHSLNC